MYTTKWFAKDFVMQKHALFKSWFDDVIVPMSVRNNSTLCVQLQKYRFISIQRELQRNNTPSLHFSPLLLNRSKLVLTLPSKQQTLQPLAPLKGFFSCFWLIMENQTICYICQNYTNHMTVHCPYNVCKFCGELGHVNKHCPYLIRTKKPTLPANEIKKEDNKNGK